jgi:hypothetical protein
MIPVKVKCPYCHKSFMDKETLIDKHPSVKVIVQYGNKRGNLYLSSLYGSYKIKCDLELPMDEIFVIFCPHCNSVLTTKKLCEECNAPMVSFDFIEGSKINICSRRGCKKHSIEFEDLKKQIAAFYSAYPVYFSPVSGKKEEKK